jgi:hypothetical protein
MDYSSEEETVAAAESHRSTTPLFPPVPATPAEIAYVKTLDMDLKQEQESSRFRNWTATETTTRPVETRPYNSTRFPSFKATPFPRKPVKILSANSNLDFPSLSGLAVALPSTGEPKVHWKDSFAKKVEDLRVKEEAEGQRIKEEADTQRKQNLFLMNTLAPRFRRRIEDIMQEEEVEVQEEEGFDDQEYEPEQYAYAEEEESFSLIQ